MIAMVDGFEPWDMDALVTAREAAQAVYVSKQLFNYWRSSNKIQPKGTDRKGHKLYRLGDVIEVEKAAFNAPTSTRRAQASAGPQLRAVNWDTLDRQPA